MASKEQVDDPFFNYSMIGKPTWISKKLNEYLGGSFRAFIRKGRNTQRIDPFTRKDVKVALFCKITKEEWGCGMTRLSLYEYLEVAWGGSQCRISLGNREQIMTKDEFSCEYRGIYYDMVDAIRIIRGACLSGILPLDILNLEGVDRYLEVNDARKG